MINVFGDDGSQNCLMFQRLWKYFATTANSFSVLEWKSKGLLNEIIKPPTRSDNSLAPELTFNNAKELFITEQ